MELFWDHFPEATELKILDVGGFVSKHAAQILDEHPNKQKLASINISQGELMSIRDVYPDLPVSVADARQLPFKSKSFDIVYSNAVIEHVGSRADQHLMAKEIQRVGRAWFVTTPNRWYPFEFHTRLPLIGWLPAPLMKKLSRAYSYDHIQRRYRSGAGSESTRLITRHELESMFPTSEVVCQRVTFWPETLIAIGQAR